jgi:hypothetical protein
VGRFSVAMLTCIAIACNGAKREHTPVPMRPMAVSDAAVVQAVQVGEPDAALPEVPRRAVPLITEPAALDIIARAGGSLGALFGAATAKDTATLAVASPRYRAILDAIKADLDELARVHPDAGVGVRGHMQRLFDVRWLQSTQTRFDLVGVAPRIDRARLPTDCGDVRLLYRLSYDATVGGERISSRLPMTISVSLAPRPNDSANGCRADAIGWRAPESIASDAAAAAQWLVSDGALAGALEPARVTLVLTNAQMLRIPAAAQRVLGGHAEYQMRAFIVDGSGALVASPLENTPDVARIRGDRALRDALLTWLREPATLDQIDRGLHRVPAQWLATRASSYSPFGLARPANRSFAALLSKQELASLPLAQRKTIATPEALLRRLDEATCHGCHQVRSVAGFHLVGVDAPDAPAGAALAVAYSPLLSSERVRRGALIDAAATGGSPDFGRPLAPPEQEPASPPAIGDACELGTVRSSTRNPARDMIENQRQRACGSGLSCTAQRGGFPNGMCQARCGALPEGAVCGVIAVHPFNDCLGSGAPFSTCIKHVRDIGLAGCSDARPCRDDYVCARTPAGDGACLPPYFLFQMRVDGHPPLPAN